VVALSRDQALGFLLLFACLAGILLYGWLLFLTGWSLLVVEVTAFIAVAGVLAILAWIGYTLATTPPPKPIEEIEGELAAETKAGEKAEAQR
jgi:predicted DNA-binding transcriptional regulator